MLSASRTLQQVHKCFKKGVECLDFMGQYFSAIKKVLCVLHLAACHWQKKSVTVELPPEGTCPRDKKTGPTESFRHKKHLKKVLYFYVCNWTGCYTNQQTALFWGHPATLFLLSVVLRTILYLPR